MPITLWIQDHSGDNNYEANYGNRSLAEKALDAIKDNGGYYTTDSHDRRIFVPWHRVDFARFEGKERG